jgi:alpha-L-rhamnosidase
MLPDGRVNPGEMTSFNHYALGAVVDFLHRVVAGLAPAAPGYRELLIAPKPSALLGRASADLDTPYGRAASRWERVGDHIELEVVVPMGTTATVILPGSEPTHRVGSGIHHYRFDAGAADVAAA